MTSRLSEFWKSLVLLFHTFNVVFSLWIFVNRNFRKGITSCGRTESFFTVWVKDERKNFLGQESPHKLQVVFVSLRTFLSFFIGDLICFLFEIIYKFQQKWILWRILLKIRRGNKNFKDDDFSIRTMSLWGKGYEYYLIYCEHNLEAKQTDKNGLILLQ